MGAPKEEFEGRKLGDKMTAAYQNALQTASKIETFNMQFFGALLKQDVFEPDPHGYECIEKNEEFAEIEYDEEIFCFLKTVPTCSKVITLYTLMQNHIFVKENSIRNCTIRFSYLILVQFWILWIS